jgi:L-cysteine:1D-myo-inositol 2-amino-2-deoxy-alpha-D-glucopyranoside ligase
MRNELANDLNAPGAIAAVDQWAEEAIRSGADSEDGSARDAALVTDAIDALLGVEL